MKAMIIESLLVLLALCLIPGAIELVAQVEAKNIVANNAPAEVKQLPAGIFGDMTRTLFFAFGCAGGAYMYLAMLIRSGSAAKDLTTIGGKGQVVVGAMITSFLLGAPILLYFFPEPTKEWCSAGGFIGSISAWTVVFIIEKGVGDRVSKWFDKGDKP